MSQLARWWPCSNGDYVDNTSPVAASTAGIMLRIAISAFDAPARGEFRRNVAVPFGTKKKLEWCGYAWVKKF